MFAINTLYFIVYVKAVLLQFEASLGSPHDVLDMTNFQKKFKGEGWANASTLLALLNVLFLLISEVLPKFVATVFNKRRHYCMAGMDDMVR